MKITFFGTSDGIPRPGHFCTSTMIEAGGNVYLVDAGAPVIDLLLRHGKHPTEIKAFFNTHGHSDHLDGLTQLLTLCGWAYKTTSFDLFMPEQRIIDAFVSYKEALMGEAFPLDRLRMQIFSAGVVYDDGVMKVTAIPTRHCEPRPSYAFLLEAEGKRVLLSGDLSQFLAKGDYPAIVSEEELDLFVCEMAHFGEEHILPYLEKCRAKRVMFNHYQPRKEADIARLAEPNRFPFPVSAAEDGEVVEL
ncbi:MAG: MBL fold metallo-hydrolase [Clostridia bacterium]|nr:MBL fold metallo-hydrolase [Clostridia bacterium]